MKLSGRNCTVNPCNSEEYKNMYPNSAKRPEYSSLDNMMLRLSGIEEPAEWRVALREYLDETGGLE